jgi:predicted MFS family arabinose efflux permease
MNLSRIAVSFIFFINGFIFANWVARSPELQQIYGLSNSAFGNLLLAMAIGALFAMPFSGGLIAKIGSQKVTTWTTFIFCTLVLGIPLMNFFPPLLILLFTIIGISTGMMDVAMNAQAVLVEQKMKKPIMSSFHAAYSVGNVVGAGVGAMFAKFAIPLPFHILAICIFGILLAIWCVQQLISEDIKTEEKQKTSAFQLPNKQLLALGLIAFCCMFGEGAMSDWTTIYMHKNIGLDKASAPLGYLCFTITMTIGRLFGDYFRQRFGDYKILIFNSLLSVFGFSIVLLNTNLILICIGFLLVGLGLSIIVPIAYSRGGSAPDLAPGVGLAMITTIGYGAFLISPPLIGYISDASSLLTAFWIVFGLFGLMLLLSLGQKEKEIL